MSADWLRYRIVLEKSEMTSLSGVGAAALGYSGEQCFEWKVRFLRTGTTQMLTSPGNVYLEGTGVQVTALRPHHEWWTSQVSHRQTTGLHMGKRRRLARPYGASLAMETSYELTGTEIIRGDVCTHTPAHCGQAAEKQGHPRSENTCALMWFLNSVLHEMEPGPLRKMGDARAGKSKTALGHVSVVPERKEVLTKRRRGVSGHRKPPHPKRLPMTKARIIYATK